MTTDAENVSSAASSIAIDLLDSCEQDFLDLAINIKENTNAIKTSTGEERKNLLRKITKQMEKADTCIRNMEMEIHSNHITDRKRLKSVKGRLQEYKAEYTQLKQDFTFEKRNLDKYDKQMLMGDDYDDKEEDMRGYGGNRSAEQIAIESKRLLDSGSESLDRSLRMISDIESQGGEILSELGSQREQIKNTRKNLSEVDGDVRTSRNILSRMEWRNMYHKMILIGIIILLIGFIVLFLYFQLR